MNILRPTPVSAYHNRQYLQHFEEEFERLYARSPIPREIESKLNSSSDSSMFKSPTRRNVKESRQSQKAKIFSSLKNQSMDDLNTSLLSDRSFNSTKDDRLVSKQGVNYRELSAIGGNHFTSPLQRDLQRLSNSVDQSFGRSRVYSIPYDNAGSSVSDGETNEGEHQEGCLYAKQRSITEDRLKSPVKMFLSMKNSRIVNESDPLKDRNRSRDSHYERFSSPWKKSVASPHKFGGNKENLGNKDKYLATRVQNHENDLSDEDNTYNYLENADSNCIKDTSNAAERNRDRHGNHVNNSVEEMMYDGDNESIDEPVNESVLDVDNIEEDTELNKDGNEPHGEDPIEKETNEENDSHADQDVESDGQSDEDVESLGGESDQDVESPGGESDNMEEEIVPRRTTRTTRSASNKTLKGKCKTMEAENVKVANGRRLRSASQHTESKTETKKTKELSKDMHVNTNPTAKVKLKRLSDIEVQKAIGKETDLNKSKGKHVNSKSKESKNEKKKAEKSEDETNKNKDMDKNKQKDLHLWIIKGVQHVQGICVEGKKSLRDDHFWHSGVVTKRVSQKVVETSSGSRYRLVGDIEALDCMHAGFSKEMIKRFKKGFPLNWKEVVADHYNPNDKNKMGAGMKTPAKSSKKNSPSSNAQAVCTPNGQFISLDSLQKTRSGRVVKPQLAWWTGQNLKMDVENNSFEISCYSKHAEKVMNDIADQYRMSSKVFAKYSHANNSSMKMSARKKNRSSDFRNDSVDDGCSIDESVEEKEDLDVEKGIMNKLNVSKQKRSQKKIPRKTCYDQSTESSQSERARACKGKKTKKLNKSRDSDSNDEYLSNTVKKVKKTSTHSRKTGSSLKKTLEIQNNNSSDEDVGKNEYDLSEESNSDDNDSEEDYVSNTVKKVKKNVQRTAGIQKTCHSQEMRISTKKTLATENNNSSDDEENGGDLSDGSNSDDDTGNDEDYVPSTVKKAKKNVKITAGEKNKRRILNTERDDDFIQSSGAVKNNRTKSSLKNSKTKKDEHSDTGLPWKQSEKNLLNRAIREIKADDPQFWDKVAKVVKTRSVEECQAFYYKDIPAKTRKSIENKATKAQEQVKLTAKKGTLKRKQQLRDFLDQHNEGYEDDLFDATPFRNKGKVKIPKLTDEDDDIFEELAKKNPDILKKIKTPMTKYCLQPVSERKTPASSLISPWSTVDRKDADKCVRQMQMKRRRLVNRKGKQTPVVKPNAPKTLSVPTPTTNLFTKSPSRSETQSLFCAEGSSSDNHDESDNENDYYWSDVEDK